MQTLAVPSKHACPVCSDTGVSEKPMDVISKNTKQLFPQKNLSSLQYEISKKRGPNTLTKGPSLQVSKFISIHTLKRFKMWEEGGCLSWVGCTVLKKNFFSFHTTEHLILYLVKRMNKLNFSHCSNPSCSANRQEPCSKSTDNVIFGKSWQR